MNDFIYELETKARQEALLNYLIKKHNESPKAYIKQKHIFVALSHRYPTLNGRDWNNTSARRMITSDLLVLKNDPNNDVIILSNPKGVKIANKSEAIVELNKEKIKTLKSLKTIYRQIKKVGLDGQTRFSFDDEEEIINTFLEASI